MQLLGRLVLRQPVPPVPRDIAHLVHDFVRSIVEGRPPAVDAVTAVTWTAPGIVGHASALAGGAPLEVPDFAADGPP